IRIDSSVLPATPWRDSYTEGRILDNGKLIAEQNNQRLKNTDNRFMLYADILEETQEFLTIEWSVNERWNFASYDKHPDYVTELPYNRDKNQILRIPDGLSNYLAEQGCAQEFDYKALWRSTLCIKGE
ncbi:MAG: hypothetical protein K2M50_07645, partial [Treponemataceae bacterium]|nr:hypothetical protein [Treponemataceae bacterium]